MTHSLYIGYDPSFTLTNVILIILMVVYFMLHFLLSYEHTSCALLDPMTDEGRPNMKLFIKSIHIENYCCFFVYDSGDRIN